MKSAGLGHLKGLKNLKDLDLSESQVNDEGLEQLKDIATLEKLNLWTTQISNAGMINLVGLTNLTWLNLDNNEIGDEGLKNIEGLTNLDFLHIGKTKVTDAGLQYLDGMTTLEELHVSFCPDINTKALKKLKKVAAEVDEDCRVGFFGAVGRGRETCNTARLNPRNQVVFFESSKHRGIEYSATATEGQLKPVPRRGQKFRHRIDRCRFACWRVAGTPVVVTRAR